MTLTAEAAQLQIVILNPDHTTRTHVLPRVGLTIGAHPDNDLILDDPEVAEHHARLEPADGHFRIVDLNTPTGTYLGETKLPPNTPTDWPAEVAMRIGETWLSLQALPDPLYNGAPATPLAYTPEQVAWNVGQGAGIYIGEPQITLAPGSAGNVTLVLLNRQPGTEHFSLTVSGVPANWMGALPAVVAVAPHTERQLELRFQLPRTSATRAGRYKVVLQFAPQESPADIAETTITLTVLAYSQFAAALNPQTFFINDHANLTIENLGNLPETYSLSVEQADEALDCRLPETPVRLNEGDSITIEITVEPPRTLWGNSGRTYPLNLLVESSAGEVQALQAEVRSMRKLPVWLIPGLAITGVGLLVILSFFLVVNWLRVQAVPPIAPTLVVVPTQVIDTDGDGISDADELKLGTNPNLIDTDGDGLNDRDEQSAGTNPLNPDSDGDTLTDGQEVLTLHTSPINADTDGDGLADNVDPDPGHLPTPAPTDIPATAVPPTQTLPTSTVIVQSAVPPTMVALNNEIAFQSQRDGTTQLYLLQASQGTVIRLTNNSANDEGLILSPRKDLFAFVSNRDGNDEIYTMKLDGTDQTRLTNNDARDFAPAWAGDNARLAFLSDRSGSIEIYVDTLDGAAPIQVTSNLTEECCLAWSPTQNLLAYMSQEAGNWGLYTMGGDGLNQKRLAAGFAATPSWSQDGTKLAFVSGQDGNSEIYTINADGSGQTRLTTNPAQDTNPVWSPDGSHIAFISDRDGVPQVYVMKADGSGPARVLATAGRQCCLVWSPNSAQLIFAGDQTGNDELYVVGLDGSGAAQLTNSPGPDIPAAWLP